MFLNAKPPVYPKVWIRGPLVPGNRVFREPHPTRAFHKWDQFINPDGESFCREVELTETYQQALAHGEIELCSAPEEPKPVQAISTKAAKPVVDKE